MSRYCVSSNDLKLLKCCVPELTQITSVGPSRTFGDQKLPHSTVGNWQLFSALGTTGKYGIRTVSNGPDWGECETIFRT